tara:strand:+ start:929 stop:1153 length:225 start_codon:yes stop_codon:yes gene_type:complete
MEDYDLIKKREKKGSIYDVVEKTLPKRYDDLSVTKGHGSLARNSYEYEILITLVDILAVLNNIDNNVANLQGEK